MSMKTPYNKVENDHHPNCACCKHNYSFQLPTHLVDEVKAGRCVIFAGAGISTESKTVLPWTFYDQISKELNVSDKGKYTFPELMSRFSQKPDGRKKLIQKLQKRFDYIDGWADLRNRASNFHRELSTMPYISEVVTTNWDNYFEKYAGMKPFVYDADIAFWNESRRSVLKVHGSIENLSSIVADLDDYEKCYKRLNEGLLGTILKQILATKTCIFIGYSLQDEDLQKIITSISPQLGKFNRQHYFVTPFASGSHFEELGMSVDFITTDGTYFLRKLKEKMCDECCYLSDDAYEYILEALDFALDTHNSFLEKFNVSDHPVILCNISYQDGVIHALQRIVDLQHTGQYSDLHSVQSKFNAYIGLADEKRQSKKYIDYCYYHGFANGLLCLLSFDLDDDLFEEEDSEFHQVDEFDVVPMHFHPKLEEMSELEFIEKVIQNPEIHKGALKECLRVSKTMTLNHELVPQRMPFG